MTTALQAQQDFAYYERMERKPVVRADPNDTGKERVLKLWQDNSHLHISEVARLAHVSYRHAYRVLHFKDLVPKPKPKTSKEQLTPVDVQILILNAQGVLRKQALGILGISVSSYRYRIERMMHLYKAETVTQLVALAIFDGVIDAQRVMEANL